MISRRLLLLAVLSLAIPVAHAAGSPVVAEVTRYLRAIQFGDTFQGGIRKANSAQGQGSTFLDRLLAATPQEIEATVAPAFAAHVKLKEARAMADFFSSPLGQKVLAQGKERVTDPGRQLHLTPQETAELEKFGQTPAGNLSVTLTSDPAIRQEYFALLKRKYGE